MYYGGPWISFPLTAPNLDPVRRREPEPIRRARRNEVEGYRCYICGYQANICVESWSLEGGLPTYTMMLCSHCVRSHDIDLQFGDPAPTAPSPRITVPLFEGP